MIVANTSFPNPEDYLPYEQDVVKLEKMFALRDGQGNLQPNVKLGINLTHTSSTDYNQPGREFDEFFDTEVMSYDQNPSFIICSLMSHGTNREEFQLANSQCEECVSQHKLTGACALRNYYTSIIDRIRRRFPEIPKVFFMQLCRGNKFGGITAIPGAFPPSTKNKADQYIPSNSDTVIVFPCADRSVSMVKHGYGSCLFTALFQATEELRMRIQQGRCIHDKVYEIMRKEVPTEEEEDGKAHDQSILSPTLEGLCGGWFDDILARVSVCVSDTLWLNDLKLPTEKCQPEIVSTLRYKLSWIRILQSQSIWDDYQTIYSESTAMSERGGPARKRRKMC